MPACGQAGGCGVCDTPELWCGAAGLLCARVRACAGAAESLHTYIHTYTHIYIYIYIYNIIYIYIIYIYNIYIYTYRERDYIYMYNLYIIGGSRVHWKPAHV